MTSAVAPKLPATAASLAQRTLGGLAWSAAGYAAQSVGQLVLLAVLARLLTPADFGVVTTTLVMVGLGRLLTHTVVGGTVIQRSQLSDDHVRAAFWLAIGAGVVTAAGLVAAAPLAADWFAMPDLAPLTRVLAIGFVVQSSSAVAGALLERELAFRAVAVVDVVSFTLGFVGVGVSLGLAGAGMWALVGAHMAQSVLQAVLLLCARPHPKAPRFSAEAIRHLGWMGGGFAVARFFNFVALQGDNVVVARTLQATALGIYGRAYQLVAMPAMLFGQIVDRVMFPVLSDLQADTRRLAATYQRVITLTVAAMAPASVVLFLAAPEVVRILLGEQWLGVVPALRVLAVGLVARTAYKASDTLSKALGTPYARAARQFAYAALVVGGAAAGQEFGVTGVAAAVTAAIVVNHLLMAQLCLRDVGLGWVDFAAAHLRAIGPALTVLAGAVPAVEAARRAGAPDVAALASLVAGAGAAAAVCWRLAPGALVSDDLRWLAAQIRTWVRR